MKTRIIIELDDFGNLEDVRLYGSVRALFLGEVLTRDGKEFASERAFSNKFNDSMPKGKNRLLEVDQGFVTERKIKRMKNV